jgi:hypothetical protein
MNVPIHQSTGLKVWVWPGSHWLLALAASFGIFARPFQVLASSCASAPTGIVGWWPGEGDAKDVTRTNDGSLLGGASASVAGMVGSAFSFDGTNAYVEFPDSPAFHPTNLTIEAWVRFSGLNSAGNALAGQQYIVFKQNTRSGTFEGFAFTKSRASGRDYFDFQVSSSSGATAEILSTTAITSNVWYHVACVRGSNFIQIYVNGQLENQATANFAQDYGSLPLFFGTSGDAGWDRKFKGTLDEVSLYNRALGSNEIAAIYAAGGSGKCRGAGPPAINTQLQNQTVAVGANVIFRVTASGTEPLNYQWQRNGVDLADAANISGSTSNVLSLANVQTNDAASFQVVITNFFGSVTSDVAVLIVDVSLRPPSITSQPVSQAVHPGTNISFTVSAQGSTPLTYQWRFSGANLSDGGQLSGASSSALFLNYVLPADAGAYSVVVTNVAGAITSAVATLVVSPSVDCLDAPAGLVGWWPGDGTARDIVGTNNGIFYGGANANAVGLNGSAFHFDGTNDYIQMPDSPAFHPTNLSVEVWVKFDAYQTPGNTFYPNQQYMVFKQNSRQFEFEGFALTKDHDPQGDVFLWEVASSGGELIRIDSVNTVVTGAWYHVVGVRGPDYSQLWMNGHLEVEASVSFPQDYGTYPLYFGTSGQSYYDRRLHGTLDEVALYNRALSSNEIVALYLSGSAGKCKGTNGLLITAQPQSASVALGNPATFSVRAVGISPVTFQWQFDGSPIPGATSSNLFLGSVQSTNAGNYSVVVANPARSILSDTAALSVIGQPLLQNARMTNGAFVFTLSGVAGQNYEIDMSTNIPDWAVLTILSNTTPETDFIDTGASNSPSRFYRARWVQ